MIARSCATDRLRTQSSAAAPIGEAIEAATGKGTPASELVAEPQPRKLPFQEAGYDLAERAMFGPTSIGGPSA